MFLWWGRDLIQFYNDGYRPSLGDDRHPSALGARGREFWAEIWPTIGPEVDGVMTRGLSTWHHDHLVPIFRNGRLEEVYWTYGYSPVFDDDGAVGGALVVVQEQTARVLGERRLRTLRDLAALASSGQTESDVWTRSTMVLGRNTNDLPAALLFAVSNGEPAPAAGQDTAVDAAQLPLREVVETGEPVLVDDLRARLGDLPGGFGPAPIETAWLVPVRRPGSAIPYGILAAFASPHLPFDQEYRDFIALAADQIATCITSAKAREEDRRRAEALAEIDRAKTNFFSNVSHEFRTPLFLMIGPTERALASAARVLGGAELELVQRNQVRLLNLVNTLLDFARIEAGRAEAVFEPTDVAAMTADIASAFRSTVEHAGLAFIVDCPPLPAAVPVDRDMWEKIVSNLLSNAFKFTFTGSIEVSLRWRETVVDLTVRDTGVGISGDELPHVFERFHRGRNTRGRTYEGSGIGLALLHELVKMHHGSVGVVSAVGEGSTFTVTIPAGAEVHGEAVRTPRAVQRGVDAYVEGARRWSLEPPSLTPDSLPGADCAADTRPGGAAGFHILVVDDNADMRSYLRRIFEPAWSVDVVADGVQALEAVRRRRPDLIVSDVMLPALDGIGLLRALRADPEMRGIPVILLTARAGERASIDGWSAGADDYLVKPFSSRELVARVEAQLMKARLRAVEEHHAQRLKAIFEHAPVGIATVRGPRHVFEFANPPYLELLSHRSIIGQPIREALPELENQGVYELLDGVYHSGIPHIGRAVRVVLNRGADGAAEEVFFDFVYQPTFDTHHQVDGIVVVVFDVTELARARHEAEAANQIKAIALTELRNARDELERRVTQRTADLLESNLRLAEALAARTVLEDARSEWLRKLINAQEDERRRVARELHDEMGQHLSVLAIGLDELKASDPAMAARLQQHAGEIERGVRRLARDLRPAALDDLGLVTALTSYVEEWSKQTGIAADFCSRNCETRLPTGVESTLYRIVQEALTNVARHAGAQNVGVVIECAGSSVTAIVEDDGRGFDPGRVGAGGLVHLGLRGIHERAALLGGTVTIESSAGTTSLFVTLPLHARDRVTSG